jgi:hypothetical protein
MIVSTREGYDRWAEQYDSDGNPLLELEEPRVDELLGDVHPAMMLRGVTARFVDPSGDDVDQELAARVPRGQRYLGFPMLLMLKLAPAR